MCDECRFATSFQHTHLSVSRLKYTFTHYYNAIHMMRGARSRIFVVWRIIGVCRANQSCRDLALIEMVPTHWPFKMRLQLARSLKCERYVFLPVNGSDLDWVHIKWLMNCLHQLWLCDFPYYLYGGLVLNRFGVNPYVRLKPNAFRNTKFGTTVLNICCATTFYVLNIKQAVSRNDM